MQPEPENFGPLNLLSLHPSSKQEQGLGPEGKGRPGREISGALRRRSVPKALAPGCGESLLPPASWQQDPHFRLFAIYWVNLPLTVQNLKKLQMLYENIIRMWIIVH